MGPKSEQDTTYSPVANGRGKKEGVAGRRRDSGMNGEREKLMIIENISRNKGSDTSLLYSQVLLLISNC